MTVTQLRQLLGALAEKYVDIEDAKWTWDIDSLWGALNVVATETNDPDTLDGRWEWLSISSGAQLDVATAIHSALTAYRPPDDQDALPPEDDPYDAGPWE